MYEHNALPYVCQRSEAVKHAVLRLLLLSRLGLKHNVTTSWQSMCIISSHRAENSIFDASQLIILSKSEKESLQHK